MRKLFLLTLGVLSLNGVVKAQSSMNLNEKIPFDKEFRVGVLPNGITYYIRHNEEPKGSASYYIIQNVGAVLEKDNQNGLAHFLEHMAFNGTATFPDKAMLNMLERNGVKFGKDVNAYTTHNETVYNISRVPVANEKIVDSCLFILRDWCNDLSLDAEQIDAERGVINEEWRSRLGVGTRLQEQVNEVKYNGSVYSHRDVIGSMDVVKNFEHKALRDFYHDWYRTDLQAVAIVGDLDVDEIEKKVKELFSVIPAVENPKERIFAEIPDNAEPLYTVGTDKEIRDYSISLNIRHREENNNTLGDLRERYVNGIFNSLLSARYKEILSKPDAPFLSASAGHTQFVRGYNVFKISARAKEGELTSAFEATYEELQRVINHGFTETELARIKKNMLVSAENRYTKSDRISSDAYCKAVKTAYLQDGAVPDAEFNYNFAKEVIPTITLEELQGFASRYLSKENRVYIINGPENEDAQLPTAADFEKVIEKIQQKELEPYVDNTPLSTTLLGSEPKGGKIVSEKKLEAFDAVEWKLSNGATVVYRFADYQKNAVSLSGVSNGGMSLYDIEELPSINGAASYVKYFGLGDFDANSLKKVLTGKTASSGYSIGGRSESVSGSATTKDVETMMQLVYMRFEEPRFDEEKFNDLMTKNLEALDRKVETSQSKMKDTLNSILSNGNPRALEFDKDFLAQVDFEEVKEYYLERMSDASDFTFYIVGDVTEETIRPLVEKYLGSLKDIDREEMWVDNGDYYPQGDHEYRIQIPMDEPKSTVLVKMKAESKYSRESVIYHSILGSILNLRYTENIREKEGGTYGVSVRPVSSREDGFHQTLDITFNCDPEKAEHLKSLVYKELEIIQKEVREDDLTKVVQNLQKNTEHRMESNGFWMGALKAYYKTGENKAEKAYLEDILENVTTKDIRKAAKRFLKDAEVLDFIFSPKNEDI